MEEHEDQDPAAAGGSAAAAPAPGPGSGSGSDEERAWEELRARWGDDDAHRGYLGRCADLESLARAGGRYKAALDAAPGDPVALRWRDEVVKRATVLALAQLPRTRPPRAVAPGLRRALLALALVAAAAMVAWILLRFPRPGAL